MEKFMSCTCLGQLSIFSENQWVWVLEDFLRHYPVHLFFKYIYLQQTQTGFHMIGYQGDSFVDESLLSNNRFPILVGAG